MFNFMDFIILFSALYIGFMWFLMKFKGVIKTGLMLSTEVKVDKCKDKEGYISEASGPLFILFLVSLGESAVGIVNAYVVSLPIFFSMGMLAVFLMYLVYFVGKSNTLYRKYWDVRPDVTVKTRKRR